jgi:hypothetical protein
LLLASPAEFVNVLRRPESRHRKTWRKKDSAKKDSTKKRAELFAYRESREVKHRLSLHPLHPTLFWLSGLTASRDF